MNLGAHKLWDFYFLRELAPDILSGFSIGRYKKKRESFTANSYLPRHRYSFDPVKTTHLLGLTASKTLWAPLSLNCIIKRMLRQELFECVKIVEFNVNSRVFHVVYQETRFLNQDACFLNQEGRRQFLISFVSERD